ncbi:MAG TPA: hypothetical protein VIL07_05780 [Symbiobacteriaceae bacterium]
MGQSLWVNWAFVLLSGLLLGGSILMMTTGTLPPPFSRRRASPLFATSVFVVGLTLLLVYGTPDLLQSTIEALFKA